MLINNVKSYQTFGAITPNGNEYEKSKDGKKYVPLVALAGTGVAIMTSKNYRKTLMGASGRRVAPLIIGVAIAGAIFLGLGAIVDGISNKKIEKDIDKYAKTGEVPEKSNKGIRNGAIIGLGLGILSAFSSRKTNVSAKLIAIPKTIIEYTALGFVYDHAVNRNRKDLQELSDNKVLSTKA